MDHHTMIKKVIKPFLDRSVYPVGTKNWWGPFWVKTHPPSTFSGNLFSCFCVILLKTNQTNPSHKWVRVKTQPAEITMVGLECILLEMFNEGNKQFC